MDPETLKELMSLFREMGGEAKSAFIWYLVASRIIPLLWTVGGVALLYRLLKVLKGLNGVAEMRHACGLSGVDWRASERDQAVRCLRKHYHEEKAKRSAS